MASSVLSNISQELAALAERVGPSVVAVQGLHRFASSGVLWRKNVVVTAAHTVAREQDTIVLLHQGKRVKAKLAGRDPGTDIAALRIEEDTNGPLPELGDSSAAKLGNLVLALARSRRGSVVASAGIIGGLSGEWRTWRGGRLDQNIRLDLALYSGFSGGA